MEVTAIIVARKGSVRVLNKSMQVVGGETLIQRKIRQLKQSKVINRIIFGSDCQEMLSHAASLEVETIQRPDYFCDETKASANDMISNMVNSIKTDIVVWAHCTNPLIEGHIYDDALNHFFTEDCDSLLSVVELREHLWKDGKPFNYNPYGPKHPPAKDLPPLYMQDGGIFIQNWQDMKNNNYFFGKKPYLYILDSKYFLDINNERDLLLAKAIID